MGVEGVAQEIGISSRVQGLVCVYDNDHGYGYGYSDMLFFHTVITA